MNPAKKAHIETTQDQLQSIFLCASLAAGELQTNLEMQGLLGSHGVGLVSGFLATGLVGPGSHFELERSALEDIGMCQVQLCVFLAVEEDLLDVAIGVAYLRSLDGQCLSVWQLH